MAQTDRQTDRAIHWNSAIFDCSGNWDKLTSLPAFVKEVHRQKEVCPSSGREHYQTHVVCHTQQRLSALRGWIQTHWKPIRGAQYIANSLSYCQKKETAVEGTFEIQKGEKYLRIHELLMAVAKALRPTLIPFPAPIHNAYDAYKATQEMKKYEDQFLFKNAARKIVQKEGLIWIDKLSNPVVEKMWNYFHKEILVEIEKEEGVFIIETPSP